MAASDREMSQCYELLIATHPIHILMPNPSPPIGPSSPQHGEGKDENLYFTLPKPPPPFFLLKYQIQTPTSPSISLDSLHSLSLFLPPCLAADHSFPNRNLIVAPARWGHQHCSTVSFVFALCICICICQVGSPPLLYRLICICQVFVFVSVFARWVHHIAGKR